MEMMLCWMQEWKPHSLLHLKDVLEFFFFSWRNVESEEQAAMTLFLKLIWIWGVNWTLAKVEEKVKRTGKTFKDRQCGSESPFTPSDLSFFTLISHLCGWYTSLKWIFLSWCRVGAQNVQSLTRKVKNIIYKYITKKIIVAAWIIVLNNPIFNWKETVNIARKSPQKKERARINILKVLGIFILTICWMERKGTEMCLISTASYMIS